MDRIISRSKSVIENNKKEILWSFIFTFFWGILAHGYMFASNSLSHDSLNEFISDADVITWKMQLGRVFWPAYQFLTRGFVTVPWLIGILSLVYIALALILIIKLFNIKFKPIICIISGVFTVNISIIAVTASYINDMDADIFAFLLAVLAAYIWGRYKNGYLIAVIPLALSIGLYQTLISVTITLVIMTLVMNLLNGEKFKAVFFKGLKSVAMLILAGVLYFICMKIILFVTGTEILTNSYNSIDTILHMSLREILSTVYYTYIQNIGRFFLPASVFSDWFVIGVHAVLALLGVVIIIKNIFSKKQGILEKLLMLALLAVLPLAVNICQILTGGMSHQLMWYGIWLMYLFVILLVLNDCKTKSKPKFEIKKCICFAVIAVILIGNVRLANAAYFIKDFEQDSNLAFFTRVVNQIDTHEDYKFGETKLAFIGRPNTSLVAPNGYESAKKLHAMATQHLLSRTYYITYFEYVLEYPAEFASWDEWHMLENHETVKNMPVYPNKGSIKLVENILVIKFQ